MSFHKQSFATRFGAMGDEAEQKFEEYAAELGIKFDRYGLNRPDSSMVKMPARVRCTPDYVTSNGLIECKGVGKDQRLKIKVEVWNTLNFWNSVWEVQLFIWDSHKKRKVLVPLEVLRILLDDPTGGVKFEPTNAPVSPRIGGSRTAARPTGTWRHVRRTGGPNGRPCRPSPHGMWLPPRSTSSLPTRACWPTNGWAR